MSKPRKIYTIKLYNKNASFIQYKKFQKKINSFLDSLGLLSIINDAFD